MREEWKYRSLQDVCNINYGTRVVQKRDKGSTYYVYGGGGATFMVDNYNREDCFIVSRFAMSSNCTRFVKGRFFLNDSGLSVHTRTGLLCQKFLDKTLLAKNDVIYSMGKGVAQRNLDMTSFKQLIIPIPPLDVQERIVAELDLLTGVIEKQKAQLKELDTLAQSIFYDMFGDVVNNEKAWNVVPLRLLCSITSSKRIFASEYCQSGIPFFRGKEVSEKSFGLKTCVELFISKKRYDEIRDAYGVPSMGDILLTAVGTIGNVWVVDDDAPFYFKDGNILWLKLREGINPVYFRFVLLKLVDAYKSSMAKGCAYNALTIVNLKEMPTVDTPYCFQNEFAHKIQSIENQKTLIKKSIEETQKLFDYTMDKYFG